MANISLQVFGSDDPKVGYISWTPVPLTILNPDGSSGVVKLTNESFGGSITKAVFMRDPADSPFDEIAVPLNGAAKVDLFIAGKFQSDEKHNGASPDSKDVRIKAAFEAEPGVVVASLELMVRVRRNANELSDKARVDFLKALGAVNGITQDPSAGPGPGQGVYTTDFVNMHVAGANTSEHGDSMFLPWHRLYLLDLERQLQEVVPEVSLPYWRFDQPAPNLFKQNFMGEMQQIPRDISQPGGEIDSGPNTPAAIFATDNPLSKWQINNTQGIPRAARFNPDTESANGFSDSSDGTDFRLRDQQATISLGGGTLANPDLAEFGAWVNASPTRRVPTQFARMESTPHGAAHMSFNGYLNDVPAAPQDPLFFLLHCNVDRLWALFQFLYRREEKSDFKSYPYQSSGDASSWKIITATQWPWDGSQSEPGSIAPPGSRENNFTNSKQVNNFPLQSPKIENAIDPFGFRDIADNLGFAYDIIPFEFLAPPQPV